MVYVEGILGLPVKELVTLTVGKAKALLGSVGGSGKPVANGVANYATRMKFDENDLLFQSRKGQGALNRTMLWRILSDALDGMGGVRILQEWAEKLRAPDEKPKVLSKVVGTQPSSTTQGWTANDLLRRSWRGG